MPIPLGQALLQGARGGARGAVKSKLSLGPNFPKPLQGRLFLALEGGYSPDLIARLGSAVVALLVLAGSLSLQLEASHKTPIEQSQNMMLLTVVVVMQKNEEHR